MLRQILTVLLQINHKLDLIIKENDFSREDAIVVSGTHKVQDATTKVKEAEGRLPHDSKP